MAKIKDIIARVDADKFNEYSDETKLRLVAVLDGKIAVDVLLLHPSETGQFNYTYPEGLEMEPLVHFPHDDLYEKWLVAQIDLMNREYEDYQNHMEQFNAAYENFVNWLLTYHTPESYLGKDAGSTGGSPLYYITAYGLAVKHGYQGTVEEWLASLKGAPGETGTFEDMTPEQIELVAERALKQVMIDATLSKPGTAADSAAVGQAVAKLETVETLGKNADLDGVTVPGRYGCQTAEVAGTLLGCPVAEPFTLDVRYSDGKGPRVGQELRPAGKGARLYRQFVGYEDILSDEAKALRARVRKVFPGEFIYIEGGDYGETGDQVDIYSGGSDTGWYSDGASTFALSTGKQLYGLMELVNSGKTFAGKTVKLTKDIVINEGVAFAWGKNAPTYSWTPIGPSTSKYFGGTLDGQGHYISGLYNVKGRDNGFMCYTVNATIKNLAIINSYFENDAVGSAKENDAQVLGTFVGRGYGITLQELYTDAYLVCTAKDWLTGGIAGFVKSEDSKVSCGPATVTSVCFAGNITTNTGVTGSLIGGIVGGTDNSYATVRNSLFIGSISTNDNQVGGIVGRISQNSVVDGCVAVGSINKQSSVGAIVGQLYQAGSFTITDCYYSGEQGLPLYRSKSDSTSTVTTTGSKALPAECTDHSMVPGKWVQVYDSENRPAPEMINEQDDPDGTAFETQLNALLSDMGWCETREVVFSNYPVLSGAWYSGNLFKGPDGYAVLTGASYDGASVTKQMYKGVWYPFAIVQSLHTRVVRVAAGGGYVRFRLEGNLLAFGRITNSTAAPSVCAFSAYSKARPVTMASLATAENIEFKTYDDDGYYAKITNAGMAEAVFYLISSSAPEFI